MSSPSAREIEFRRGSRLSEIPAVKSEAARGFLVEFQANYQLSITSARSTFDLPTLAAPPS
ncbi:MAG: hypothetical protein ACO3RV_03170 [Luteolibacter sp.]